MSRIDKIVQGHKFDRLEKRLDIVADRVEKLEKIITELKLEISEIRRRRELIE